MNIDDNKLDQIFTEQRNKFQRTCEKFQEDMDLRFNKILEDGNAIIETLRVISADMKNMLSDIEYIKEILK